MHPIDSIFNYYYWTFVDYSFLFEGDCDTIMCSNRIQIHYQLINWILLGFVYRPWILFRPAILSTKLPTNEMINDLGHTKTIEKVVCIATLPLVCILILHCLRFTILRISVFSINKSVRSSHRRRHQLPFK